MFKYGIDKTYICKQFSLRQLLYSKINIHVITEVGRIPKIRDTDKVNSKK